MLIKILIKNKEILYFALNKLVTKKIKFSHNPFSMPQGEMEALEKKDPLDIKAYQYDIVCNGVELSSGAIRNHKPEIMYKAFDIAGYSKKELEDKYEVLKEDYNYLSKKLDEMQNREKIEQKIQLEFSEKIDELNQETDSLMDEIEKWPM